MSARDRCDETVDHIRSVRKGDFKYIRNYLPQRPYLQPSNYKDGKPFMPVLRELYAAGKLKKPQSLHLAETRPAEELYDLSSDLWEIHNLAGIPPTTSNLQNSAACSRTGNSKPTTAAAFPNRSRCMTVIWPPT